METIVNSIFKLVGLANALFRYTVMVITENKNQLHDSYRNQTQLSSAIQLARKI